MKWKFWAKKEKPNSAKKHSVIVVQVDRAGVLQSFSVSSSGSMDALLSRSVWAFAAMQRNVQALCSVKPIIQNRGQGGAWEERNNEFAELDSLIMAPAGDVIVPRMSWSDWFEVVLFQLYIWGRAAIDVRLGKLVPLASPRKLKAKTDSSGRFVAWDYDGQIFSREDIVLLHVAGADGQFANTSPFEAATNAVVSEATASERARNNLVNRVAPGLIFRVPESWLDPQERDETSAWLIEQYQEASKTGYPMVLSTDSDVESPPDYKAMSEELFNSAKMARDGILAVFGTPPPVLGIYDQATLSNFEKSYKIWWEAILLPMYSAMLDQLNTQFIMPRYGARVRLWYGLEDTEIGIIRRKARADLAKAYMDLGYPSNIAAKQAGLDMPYVKELDVPNVSWIVAGRAEPENGSGG